MKKRGQPRVSVLAANLSSNALGRAYLLAQVLRRRYEVEVLGPAFGHGIWPPCDTGEFAYRMVPGCNFPCFFLSMRDLLRLATGDVIYAVKPRLSSFGVGLLAKWRRGVPLILDIDDWDLEGAYAVPLWRRALGLAKLYDPYASIYLRLLERFFPFADAITTVSTALQERFGGLLVPHGRDTDFLDPAKYSGIELRQKWGLNDHKIVMFLGTPRPHKGLEDLIAALHRLDDLPVTLVVVGVDWSDPYTARLKTLGRDRIRLFGMQPFTEIPRFLAAADIVALPQRNVPFAQAQVPAKVFDAMAMAKPIVATAVGDLPRILDKCGVIVSPGDIWSLSEAIRRLVTQPTWARHLGELARQQCMRLYSWNVMERSLSTIIDELLEKKADGT